MFFQSFWSSKEQHKKKEKKDKVIAVLLCICKRIHLERRLAFYSKQCSCIIGVISGVVYVYVYHVMNPFVRVSSNTFMSSLLTFRLFQSSLHSNSKQTYLYSGML